MIVGTITLPFRARSGVLIGSLLFSIVVECVGMHLFWKDQGWRHSQQMLQYELGHLSTTSRAAWWCEAQAHGARAGGYRVRVGVRALGVAGAHEPDRRARPRAQPRAEPQLPLLHQPGLCLGRKLPDRAAFTTLTFLVRLLVLVLTLPLILTAAFVGLIDGLVRRDVRRFGAGRESGFIYHRAKASLMPLAVLPLGHLSRSAHIGASSGHPAAQRGDAGDGSQPDRRQLQEVLMR
ncbi:TIGR03747 family integrating conjugative element membrane protein [Pseudomonas aeruginosa]